jgi:diguanylate cyclase (GGDEF)-like protein
MAFQQDATTELTPKDGRLRLLLVEHNETDARVLLNLIRHGSGGSVEVTWVSSFVEALGHLRKNAFDAMLLDLFLPDSDGIESIRRVSDRADIPIIALAKESAGVAGIDVLMAGAEDSFIKESINSQNMIRAVRYAIARHRRIGELQVLSQTDELTGLYNRRAFMTLGSHQIKVARREKHSVTLAFADVDGLKAINDRCGHMWGDFALKDISTVLKNTFRESDIIARIGGDEFAILWISEQSPSAESLHSRLKAGLDAHAASETRPYHLGLSIGFSLYPGDSDISLEDMLFETDRRMYVDKRTGINR